MGNLGSETLNDLSAVLGRLSAFGLQNQQWNELKRDEGMLKNLVRFWNAGCRIQTDYPLLTEAYRIVRIPKGEIRLNESTPWDDIVHELAPDTPDDDEVFNPFVGARADSVIIDDNSVEIDLVFLDGVWALNDAISWARGYDRVPVSPRTLLAIGAKYTNLTPHNVIARDECDILSAWPCDRAQGDKYFIFSHRKNLRKISLVKGRDATRREGGVLHVSHVYNACFAVTPKTPYRFK